MQREDPKNQMSYYCKYSKKSQEIFEKSIDGSIVQFGNSESITIMKNQKIQVILITPMKLLKKMILTIKKLIKLE